MGKPSRRPNRATRSRHGAGAQVDMSPVVESLMALDEKLTAEKGADWIYREDDYPAVMVDGETYTLGPKSVAVILELRRIGERTAETGRTAYEAGMTAP